MFSFFGYSEPHGNRFDDGSAVDGLDGGLEGNNDGYAVEKGA